MGSSGEGDLVPGKPGSAFEPIHLSDDVWARHDAVLRERDVGRLFHLAKRYAGASQHRIATATGVPQSRVNALMNGRCGPVTSIEVLERIADGLNWPDHARASVGLAARRYPDGATRCRAEGRRLRRCQGSGSGTASPGGQRGSRGQGRQAPPGT